MVHDLSGDREVEYGYVRSYLPRGEGLLLDLGPDNQAGLIRLSLERCWTVVGIGLEGVQFKHPRFLFIKRDFLEVPPDFQIDCVLNISTIEHFGIAGRYGVAQENLNADLEAMAKLRQMMSKKAEMLLTIPVGIDSIISPWHRVYGRERLGLLLRGYRAVRAEFWAKPRGEGIYERVAQEEALSIVPQEPPDPHYYALGTFTLRVGDGKSVLHLL